MAIAPPSSPRQGDTFCGITGVPSSSQVPNKPYDVFINHRGPDVKLNLASLIYNVLELVGVQTFLDKDEICVGDLFPRTIEDAIRSASTHIAIFSKNYAASPWCLEELACMLETNVPVIPVFYYVKPADLRWNMNNGSYAKAFSKHKRRYNDEKLKRWRDALHEVSFYKGFEFNSRSDSGLLVNQIVRRVWQEIKEAKLSLHVAEYPVGLGEAVRGFENARSAGRYRDVEIVGIVGIRGIGKTTLAKELYNRNLSAYDTHSFLCSVRERKMHKLQEQLLKDVLHRSIEVKNVSLGKSILAGRLSNRRVLIVLDDVDKGDQLKDLLPEMGRMLGSGSLIIVTTVDLDVLRSCCIYKIYNMEFLNHCQAKQLFCWHAFANSSPPIDFEDLVETFIDASGGLPLSLKVIGGTLHGKGKEEWQSLFGKISRKVPNGIREVLRRSYDSLDPDEKSIFLDVACFFNGEKKSLATAVWAAAGWVGLEGLMSKNLVEVDKQNRLTMHNHLRDLGREIAATCLPYRLGLWFPQNMKKIRRYTQDIRGIMAASTQFNPSEAHDEFPTCCDRYPRPFEKCTGLKIWSFLELLVIAGDCSAEGFDAEPMDLVWLRWFEFQHTKLPSWLSLANLRVLELYDTSTFELLWEKNVQPLEELRELIITATGRNIFYSFPSKISGLKLLTKLALISCDGKEFHFSTLPDEFCYLQSLEHLELRQCKLLKSLPARFGDLRNLRHLDLSGCERLVLQRDALQNITQLENLYLSGCWRLMNIPDQITKQAGLRELRLDGTNLKELPSDIGQLGKLEVLKIGSPSLKRLPDSLGHLPSLKSLIIMKCHFLECLPETLGNLKVLEDLSIEASRLRSLPLGYRQLVNLRTLKICNSLYGELDFGSSFSLKKLTMIDLRRTHVTRIPISRQCCPRLERLILSNNDNLEEIENLKAEVEKELPECEIRII